MKSCENCLSYDGTYCIRNWNNAERDYCIPVRDLRKESDCCADWEGDEDDTE